MTQERPHAEKTEDLEWAAERVRSMCASAFIDAGVYGPKLLKGFGYPNETFSRAQDARALQMVLQQSALVADLVSALKGFLEKWDQVEPRIVDMFGLHYSRTGVQYDGPSVGPELEQLRALLKRVEGL